MAAVAAYAERRPTRRGEVLYDQGEEGYDFVVVLDGRVGVVDGSGADRRLAGVHGRRRFLGELGLLTGQGAVLTALVLEPGEVLLVPPERARELFSRHPGLGDLVLRSYLLRRALAIEDGASMGIVGSRSVPDTGRLRRFAGRNHLRRRWVDLEDDRRGPGAAARARGHFRADPGRAVARPARAGQPQQRRAGPHDRPARPQLGRDHLRPGAGRGGHGELAATSTAAADGSAVAARPVTPGARPARLAAPRLDEFEQTGVPYARPLLDARLWADEPEPSGRRQFGRTHDVVLFPSRDTVVR